MSASSKLPTQAGEIGNAGQSAGGPKELSGEQDSQLQNSFHDRTYNPVNSIPTRSVSSELNTDAARFKKGPGPL